MLGLSALLLGAYGAVFLPNEALQAGVPRAFAQLAAVFTTALVLAVALALPIRTLFPRAAVKASLAVGAMPALGFLAFGLMPYPLIGILFFTAIVGGTYAAIRMK